MNLVIRSPDLCAGQRRGRGVPVRAIPAAMLGTALAAAGVRAQQPPAQPAPAPQAASAPAPAASAPAPAITVPAPAVPAPAPAAPAAPPARPASVLPVVKVRAGAEQETATGPVPGYVARRSATGTKTDTPIIETPQSISVITADRLEAIGATTMRDGLGYTPGVNISPWGTDSRYDSWINLRGFDAYKPGFNLDGLPLRNAETWGWFQTENYGTERIEVLRGPASVLYGQGGPGGTVNVVSKRPQAETQREIRLQVSDPQRRQLAGDFTGAAVEDGSVLYRLTASLREGEVFDGLLPDDRVYIAPALTLKLAPDTTFTVLSHLLSFTTSTHGGAPELGTLLPNPNGPISPDVFPGEPGFDHFDHDQWAAGYQLEHRLNALWTFRHSARHAELTLDYQAVSAGAFVDSGLRAVNRNVFFSREDVNSFSTDNQLQARFAAGSAQHTLLLGLDHQRSRFDIVAGYGFRSGPNLDLYAPVYGAAITLPDPFMDTNLVLKQTGLYLQDQVRFGGRWSATVGTRYDDATTDGANRLPGGAPLLVNDHAVSSRAGLVYLHPAGWAPYLGYSESFSPSTTLDTATGLPFKPETGRLWEAGVRWQPAEGAQSVSVAVFDLRRRNYVTNDATFTPHQTGEVQVRGLELEAAGRLRQDLNFVASYSFTPRAIVIASSNPDEVGKQLNPVPRHQGSVWGDYRFGHGFKGGLGLRYIGSHRGTSESASVPLPSYTLVDALLAREIGLWSLALNVRNLADEVYLSNCSAGTCYFGDPRQVTLSATYRW